MNTIVLKFGGSSVADNIKLNVVANKIIEIKKETPNVVVVVSAQGKTTDRLIAEARELSAIPNEREMDMLLSTGEQVSAAKLSILLNRKGYPTVSLSGWQAGIQTNKIHESAKIESIYPERILKELKEGKIVIVTGFQGIDENQDITTLGRGGSDTTAIAIEAAIGADKCYIFSDVDGVYSGDPKSTKIAKKLSEISFDEMQEAADAGAKVLHNRCIQIGKKFNCDIYAKSTFSDGEGTKICKEIEKSEVKNIVKNDNLMKVKLQKKVKMTPKDVNNIYKELLKNNIITESFKSDLNVEFVIKKIEQNKVAEILENKFADFDSFQSNITKLTIVGYSIIQDNVILNKVVKILEESDIKINEINLNQLKIEIISDNIPDDVTQKIHDELIF